MRALAAILSAQAVTLCAQVLKAVAQESARVEQRQGRHKREQKRAYARMVQGGREEAPCGRLHGWWRASASWASRDNYGGAMALVGAAVVAAFAAALLLIPRLPVPAGAAPEEGTE